MDLLDTIPVAYQGHARTIELFAGDLTHLPPAEAVDLLVVSAFPDDYTQTRSSLIGALARSGVSVADLAADKEVDLRQFSSCWLSRPLNRPDVPFDRILCFEPRLRGRATEVVGDIFRCLFPFTTGQPPISQIALPLVASGDQGEPDEAVLEALVDAAVHWLAIGLPLERIKIVLHHPAKAPQLRETFARLKPRYASFAPRPPQPAWDYDVFISYSWKNKDEVDLLLAALRRGRPALRPFLDRLELRPGAAWQQHIFEALDQSCKVICVLSPDYLASKICQEEFNIALLRHRESPPLGVLLPLYLYTADLPTYMRIIQYADAREGDTLRITQSAGLLLGQIESGPSQEFPAAGSARDPCPQQS